MYEIISTEPLLNSRLVSLWKHPSYFILKLICCDFKETK